jgi:hypothetical protein
MPVPLLLPLWQQNGEPLLTEVWPAFIFWSIIFRIGKIEHIDETFGSTYGI